MNNYPAGCEGYKSCAEYECINTHCADYGKTWEVCGWTELGSFTPDDERDAICPECGEEAE